MSVGAPRSARLGAFVARRGCGCVRATHQRKANAGKGFLARVSLRVIVGRSFGELDPAIAVVFTPSPPTPLPRSTGGEGSRMSGPSFPQCRGRGEEGEKI
jgi:hypothetical protein